MTPAPEAILGWFEDMAMSARAGVIFRSDARRKLRGKLIPQVPNWAAHARTDLDIGAGIFSTRRE